MNHQGSSHIGLYRSTLDLDKIREFYEAFWVLISNRRHDKNQRRRARTDSRPPLPARRQPALSSGGIMTAPNYRSNREGILLPRVIECPVCGERADSFRIRRVMDLLTVEGEFYHRTATCAGSMTPDMPTAMDLLRLAVEEAAKRLNSRFRLNGPATVER
jgi:hypothetical protein